MLNNLQSMGCDQILFMPSLVHLLFLFYLSALFASHNYTFVMNWIVFNIEEVAYLQTYSLFEQKFW